MVDLIWARWATEQDGMVFECLTRLQGPQASCHLAWGLHLVREITDLIRVSTRQIIIITVCDARFAHGRDGRSRLRLLAWSRGCSKAYSASSAAASQLTASHRLASRSSCLDSATHRMLSRSRCSSRVRVDDVCVWTCNSGCDGTGTGQGDEQRAHIGNSVTGNWDWRRRRSLALTRRLSVTALRDMGTDRTWIAGGRQDAQAWKWTWKIQ